MPGSWQWAAVNLALTIVETTPPAAALSHSAGRRRHAGTARVVLVWVPCCHAGRRRVTKPAIVAIGAGNDAALHIDATIQKLPLRNALRRLDIVLLEEVRVVLAPCGVVHGVE